MIRAAPVRGIAMLAVIEVILLALQLYFWIVIASAVFSWLYAFNVVNPRNQFVGMVGRFLYQVTEPALRPIRRIVPTLGAVDISPVILLLIIYLIQRILVRYVAPYVI
jgi:YggT family protein